MSAFESEYPLNPLCRAWLEKIKSAEKFKIAHFQEQADEAMTFFECGKALNDLMWDTPGSGKKGVHYSPDDEDLPAPKFRMVVGKVAEIVELFGPSLYHRNPSIVVEPKLLDIPTDLLMTLIPPDQLQQYQMQAQQTGQPFDPNQVFPPDPDQGANRVTALLLNYFLDYIQRENDKKTHSRRMIDEALIKGMGCLAGGTEVYAKIDGRPTVIRVKDLNRVKGNAELWDGDKWNRVTKMKTTPRKGDEICLTLRSGEEIHCTRDHGWPSSRGLVRADELQVGDFLNHAKLSDNYVDAGDHLPDDIGWFVGVYLGDGHIPSDKRDVCVCIAGHVDETFRHERLEKVVRNYGGTIKWNTIPGTKKQDAVIYSRVLVAILREYVTKGGAFDKHLKTTCWERTDGFLRSLLQGYFASDGHWVEDEEIWRLGFCENKQLAKDIRTLCGRLGMRLTLKLQKEFRDGKEIRYYKGAVRTKSPAKNSADLGEIVSITPADWRCDLFYDIAVESDPHTYCLASGLVTHNCLWTESFRSFEGGPELIGSFYDTVDNLLVDPDAETIEEALWIARKCTHPVWQVAEEYGIDQDFLEEKYGTRESANSSAESTGNDDLQMKRKIGKTNDLIDYWKIYSKMGMGHKLKGIKDLDRLEDFLDEMGDNCYIVVADKIPYPLSLRQKDVEELFTEPDEETEAQLKEQLFQNCQWPIPFWADGAWPFTHLSFHDVPNNPWPMSHVKPALGYLKFLNWIMSFLANKIRVVCRTVAVAMKGMEVEFRDRLMSGKDFEVLEVPASMLNGGTLDVSKLVQFLQMPEFHGDIWKVVEAVAEYFDKATGLTELMYASHGGVRSAAESNAKQAAQNIRPDDMANKVEDCMSLIARKEALAARWLLQPDAVQPILGTRGTMLWARHVMSGDLNKVSREYNYRIEAGSARKPNKETAQANINMAIQTWMPFIQMELQKGNVDLANAFIETWGKAFDIETKKFLLPQTPPPPNPEMMKVQAEMQKMQQEAQIKQQESGMRQQESQSKLALELRKSEMEIAAKQHEMQLDAAAKQQEMQLDMQATQMEMAAEKAKVGLDLQAAQAMNMQKIQMGRMDMANEARMGEMKLKMQGAEHKQKLELQKKQMAMKPKPAGGAK